MGVNQARDVELGPYFCVVPKNKLAGTDLCTPYLHDMSRSAIGIPSILQAMFFLRALHPRYKTIIDLFASKQRDISVASIDSIILDARFMDEFPFFGSNGNPAPISDDLLDTASQLESIDDDDYPPAQAPLDEFNPPSDSPLGIHMPADTADDSVSVGIG